MPVGIAEVAFAVMTRRRFPIIRSRGRFPVKITRTAFRCIKTGAPFPGIPEEHQLRREPDGFGVGDPRPVRRVLKVIESESAQSHR